MRLRRSGTRSPVCNPLALGLWYGKFASRARTFLIHNDSVDGALHWAAACATAHHFGIGGSMEVCEYLLSQLLSVQRCTYVNYQMHDGNLAAMWASWSRSLPALQLLFRNCTDVTDVANRDDCTAAHWASSGGNVRVCQYLADACSVNFF